MALQKSSVLILLPSNSELPETKDKLAKKIRLIQELHQKLSQKSSQNKGLEMPITIQVTSKQFKCLIQFQNFLTCTSKNKFITEHYTVKVLSSSLLVLTRNNKLLVTCNKIIKCKIHKVQPLSINNKINKMFSKIKKSNSRQLRCNNRFRAS